jgi:hypothetical protein
LDLGVAMVAACGPAAGRGASDDVILGLPEKIRRTKQATVAPKRNAASMSRKTCSNRIVMRFFSSAAAWC